MKLLKKVFWKLPLPGSLKEKLRIKYAKHKFEKEYADDTHIEIGVDGDETIEYARYVLSNPTQSFSEHKDYCEHKEVSNRAILVAYYLTQYSPDPHNDLWWGRGTTEWNNVSRAVPQFVGHRQPRLPGELGFYDLRIKDVMRRQIEIAKNYSIDVFNFYYYWFADERILERPLDMFLQDTSLDMPFMICWVNENWTRRFSGTDESVLIGMDDTVENYKKFIHSVLPILSDERYFHIGGKIALQIYRPSLIPEIKSIVGYWRSIVRQELNKELYLIACQERDATTDWCSFGFDAENEWMMGSIRLQCKDITKEVCPIRKDFSGEVLDYKDMVENKKYFIPGNRKKKVFPAVMPAWDNSARRNNRGTIFHNSMPSYYEKWLIDIIREVQSRQDLDAPIVFINAWNEWGEGAYLEPDRDLGYAFLEATWSAKEKTACIEIEGAS